MNKTQKYLLAHNLVYAYIGCACGHGFNGNWPGAVAFVLASAIAYLWRESI